MLWGCAHVRACFGAALLNCVDFFRGRGLDIASNAEVRHKYENHKTAFKVGSLITFAAFTSVSLDDKIAEDFGDHVLFMFTKVRGVRIASLSQYPREAEILVPPPSVYTIKNCAMFHGSLVVTLECVDSPLTYLSPDAAHSSTAVDAPVVESGPFMVRPSAKPGVSSESPASTVTSVSSSASGGSSAKISWGSKNAPKIMD